jgi:hypothetical protein
MVIFRPYLWHSQSPTKLKTTAGRKSAAVTIPSFVPFGLPKYLSIRIVHRAITIYIGSVLIIIGGLWNAFAQDLGQYAGGEQSYTNSCAILTPEMVPSVVQGPEGGTESGVRNLVEQRGRSDFGDGSAGTDNNTGWS